MTTQDFEQLELHFGLVIGIVKEDGSGHKGRYLGDYNQETFSFQNYNEREQIITIANMQQIQRLNN